MVWCATVLALAFLMPNHYSPWLSFHSEVVAALAFAPLMLWASWHRGPLPALTIGALLLALVPLLQIMSGQIFFAGDGWTSALYLLGFSLAILAGSRWTNESIQTSTKLQDLNYFWVGLAAAAYISVAIALLQWLGMGAGGIYMADMPPGGRAFANLAQPNQLATLLLLALAAHIALFEAARVRAAFALSGALFLTIGLVLTGSRSVLLALVWLWPAYGLLWRRCDLRTTPLAVIAVSVFYIVLSWLWPLLNQALLLSPDVPVALDRLDSSDVRTVFWTSMLDALGHSPWVGYGWAQIGLAQSATALDYAAVHQYFDSSHNMLLDLLLWNGVPIGLCVIGGLLAWLVWQVRQCRDPIAWTALLAIGFVLSHAMVEYPLQYAYFLLPVGFLMGVLSALHPSPADQLCKRLPQKVQRVVMVAAAVLTLALFGKLIVEYPVWEQDWRFMRFQEARIGEPEHVDLPHPILLTQLYEFMKFSRTEAKSGMSADQLEWMRQVSGRFGHASAMYRYALALALNQHPEEASQALRRLCQMHTEVRCAAAQYEWGHAAQDKYPMLKQIPFPVTSKK